MKRTKALKATRACLICGGTTTVAHLGLDICRACTVFYRRSRDRKFTCRSTTNDCPIGEGIYCRKCRLRKIERFLAYRSPSAKGAEGSLEAKQSSSTAEDMRGFHAMISMPSTSSSLGDIEQPKQRGLLEKLRHSYRGMCETGLAGELCYREEPPHPLAVVNGDFAIIPATFGGMEYAHRLTLTALLQLGAATFPEFAQCKDKDQWTIVTNFFTRFRMFESCYRADKTWSDDLTKTFAGFSMYWSPDIGDHFYDDCPTDGGQLDEAKRVAEVSFKTFDNGRAHMRRANMRHEEFLAVICIMFWTTEGLDVSEEVTRASQTYKEKILKELHSYYRDELQLTDYAARLGELLMMLPIYEQRAVNMDEHFEMMRLLNVFTDDTLVYRLA